MSDVAEWWQTSIIDMEPGRISIRGHEIQDLIGNLSFAEMVWLMLCGVKPEAGQARLLEAALVASVDHGPQAPSIAAARMAVTCGLGLNGAMGTAVHMLDDVHGGAGEQLVREARDDGVVSGKFMELAMAIERHLAERKGKPVPMNIDGATAVIFAELGFAPPLARGLFCLSRSVGAMAHGYEQMQQGGRNKGPTPPHYRWSYTGKD